MAAEEYREEYGQLGDFIVRIITYKIGPRYHCHLEGVDPGVTIARSEASTREEALSFATAKANDRLHVSSHHIPSSQEKKDG